MHTPLNYFKELLLRRTNKNHHEISEIIQQDPTHPRPHLLVCHAQHAGLVPTLLALALYSCALLSNACAWNWSLQVPHPLSICHAVITCMCLCYFWGAEATGPGSVWPTVQSSALTRTKGDQKHYKARGSEWDGREGDIQLLLVLSETKKWSSKEQRLNLMKPSWKKLAFLYVLSRERASTFLVILKNPRCI